MKIDSITLAPVGSKSSDYYLSLSLRDPQRLAPYNVKHIVGLDSDELVPLFVGNSVATDRASFYDTGMRERVVVMRIELNPDVSTGETYSDLRDHAYRAISRSKTGQMELQFMSGTVTKAVLTGFVTKLEATQFTKTPEVQITVTCRDPLLRAPSLTTVPVAGINSNSFSITDDVSTAAHGVIFEIDVVTARGAFNIQDNPRTWAFRINPYDFLVNDIIQISSEHNNKYVRVRRGTSTIELANAVEPGTHWPVIFPGNNIFQITPNPTSFRLRTISYRQAFWGI